MATGWHVVSQRHQEELTPAGTFEPCWIITYQTDPDGVVGSIKVSARLYSEEYVRDRINELAAINSAVQNL